MSSFQYDLMPTLTPQPNASVLSDQLVPSYKGGYELSSKAASCFLQGEAR